MGRLERSRLYVRFTTLRFRRCGDATGQLSRAVERGGSNPTNFLGGCKPKKWGRPPPVLVPRSPSLSLVALRHVQHFQCACGDVQAASQCCERSLIGRPLTTSNEITSLVLSSPGLVELRVEVVDARSIEGSARCVSLRAERIRAEQYSVEVWMPAARSMDPSAISGGVGVRLDRFHGPAGVASAWHHAHC